MKRIAPLLLAGALALATLVPAPAEAASLRATSATVQRDRILLGDLFDGIGPDQAQRPVAMAPAPGQRLTLDAVALANLAAAHGLDWRPLGGADRVMVERATHTVSAEDITTLLRDALAAAGAPEGLELTLDNRTLSLNIPAEAAGTIFLDKVVYDAARNRASAEIVAMDGAETLARLSFGARAIQMVPLPVLNRRILPGEIIQSGDIDWQKVPADRVGQGMVADAAVLVGMAAKRSLAPERPLRQTDVQAPVVVTRGAIVTILLQTPVMTLTAQGRALADGAQGQTIRVTNTSSNRTIEAVVAGPDVVTVRPVGMAVANPMVQAALN